MRAFTITKSLSADRKAVIRHSTNVRDPSLYEASHAACETPTDVGALNLCSYWAQEGGQSVLTSHTYAAALMVSEYQGILADYGLPWPCFEIQVPTGMLRSSHGQVLSIFALRIPDDLPRDVSLDDCTICIGYLDEHSWGINVYRDLPSILSADSLDNFFEGATPETLPPHLVPGFDHDLEARLWSLIGRLVAGVTLSIHAARADNPAAYAQLPYRTEWVERQHVMKPNVHKVGAPTQTDCRPVLNDYLNGVRDSPAIRVLVRPHWRNQAYGPRWSLRRPTFIEAHYRGGPKDIQLPPRKDL